MEKTLSSTFQETKKTVAKSKINRCKYNFFNLDLQKPIIPDHSVSWFEAVSAWCDISKSLDDAGV